MTRLRAFGIAGAALAIVIALALFLFAPRRDAVLQASLRGTPVDPPRRAADFVLTGTDGRPAHIIEPTDRVTFLFFGYTHCPDECPLALASLGRAYRSLTPARAAQTRIVFVTVDPKRDPPHVVARYVAAFDRRIVGLTGSAQTLAAVWRAYGLRVVPSAREIVHNASIVAIDDGGRIVVEYPPDVAASDLAADAAVLADEP